MATSIARPSIKKFLVVKGKSSWRCQTQHLGIVRFHLFPALNKGTSQTSKTHPNAFKRQKRSGLKSISVSMHINAEKRDRVLAKFSPKFQVDKRHHASLQLDNGNN
jgi:hypothetical protein